MEQCLLSYFIRNEEIVSSCDFNPLILHQGTAIYEVIRIINAKPLFIDEHINRFYKSAEHEKLEIKIDKSDIKRKIRVLIEQNKMQAGNIRFQYLRNTNNVYLFLAWAIPFHYPTESETKNGVFLRTLNAIRQNPQSKRANLPVREIADKMISEQVISEVLLLNEDGLITECSSSNIFFIKNKKLITPPSSIVLEGITRKKVIAIAANNNTPVSEKKIYYQHINHFDSCFISSTSKSILPVHQIDDVLFNVENRLITNLSNSYKLLVSNHLAAFKW